VFPRAFDQERFPPDWNEPGFDGREQETRRLNNQGQTPRRKGAAASWDFSKITIFPPSQQASIAQLRLQAKLTIGSINDPLEQEADRVADQVMRMLAPEVAPTSATPQVSRKCAGCEADEEEKLQKKEARTAEAASSKAPPIVHEVLRSSGQPLDAGTRTFFEPRFGRDFGGIRIHTDAKGAESARAMNALAYTVGQHVVFNASQYTLHNQLGRRLLAHELVHTLQQGAAQQPEVALRQAAVGGGRKLQIFEPRLENLQRLVDAAKKLQRYAGSVYSSLAEKTSAKNPLAPVFFPEVSRIDGDVGEMLRQALLGVQRGRLPAQQYADTIYGLSSAKNRLDSILIRARLARPAKGGQVVTEFVDPYEETVDLTDVADLMQLLPKGVIPGTAVTYGTSELLHKK